MAEGRHGEGVRDFSGDTKQLQRARRLLDIEVNNGCQPTSSTAEHERRAFPIEVRDLETFNLDTRGTRKPPQQAGDVQGELTGRLTGRDKRGLGGQQARRLR